MFSTFLKKNNNQIKSSSFFFFKKKKRKMDFIKTDGMIMMDDVGTQEDHSLYALIDNLTSAAVVASNQKRMKVKTPAKKRSQ